MEIFRNFPEKYEIFQKNMKFSGQFFHLTSLATSLSFNAPAPYHHPMFPLEFRGDVNLEETSHGTILQ